MSLLNSSILSAISLTFSIISTFKSISSIPIFSTASSTTGFNVLLISPHSVTSCTNLYAASNVSFSSSCSLWMFLSKVLIEAIRWLICICTVWISYWTPLIFDFMLLSFISCYEFCISFYKHCSFSFWFSAEISCLVSSRLLISWSTRFNSLSAFSFRSLIWLMPRISSTATSVHS